MALFGRAAAALERRTYADDRSAGAAHTAALLGALGTLGLLVERAAARRGPLWTTVATAAATYVVLGGTSLARTGGELADLLDWHGSATSPAGLQRSSRVPKLEGEVQA